MKEFKSMKHIDLLNRDKAVEIVSKSDDKLRLMVSLQYELLNKIVDTKKLEFDGETFMEKTILALIDELNEAAMWKLYGQDILAGINIGGGKETLALEYRYELVDAMHFVLQLLILGAIKHKGLQIGEYNSNVVDDVLDILYGNTIDYTEPDNYSLLDAYIRISSVLENMKWKHWKTYTDDPFNFKYYSSSLVQIFEIILQLHFHSRHGRFADNEDVQVAIAEFAIDYVVKNIENFDRQNRGY